MPILTTAPPWNRSPKAPTCWLSPRRTSRRSCGSQLSAGWVTRVFCGRLPTGRSPSGASTMPDSPGRPARQANHPARGLADGLPQTVPPRGPTVQPLRARPRPARSRRRPRSLQPRSRRHRPPRRPPLGASGNPSAAHRSTTPLGAGTRDEAAGPSGPLAPSLTRRVVGVRSARSRSPQTGARRRPLGQPRPRH